MSDRAFEVGSIETPDGPLSVGVDCGAVGVYVGGWLIEGVTLTAAQAEEFAQMFVSAVWQAGQQKARMDEENAAKGAFDMAPGMSSGLPPRTCTCGQWPHDQHCPALDDR